MERLYKPLIKEDSFVQKFKFVKLYTYKMEMKRLKYSSSNIMRQKHVSKDSVTDSSCDPAEERNYLYG